jgi:hypothetical protein
MGSAYCAFLVMEGGQLGSVMTTFSLSSENKTERSPDKEYYISIYDGESSIPDFYFLT